MWGFHTYNDIILYPPRRKAMNVLNIPKQSDIPLYYSGHARFRHIDRDIPKPKYVPLDARLIDRQWDLVEECFTYKLEYTYNDRDYILVVSQHWDVITLMTHNHHWQHKTKECIRHQKIIEKLKKRPQPYKRKSKYNHNDILDNEEYNYA